VLVVAAAVGVAAALAVRARRFAPTRAWACGLMAPGKASGASARAVAGMPA